MTLKVRITPLERRLDRAIERGQARAELELAYFIGHKHVYEAGHELGTRGAFQARLSLPKDGKYHAHLHVTAGGKLLGQASFNLCVGADPEGPRAAEVCPHMGK